MSGGSLGEALGQPAGWEGLPTRRSRGWGEALTALGGFVRDSAVVAGRGPAWLWARLRRSAFPADATWGALLEGWWDASPERVLGALHLPEAAADLKVWSWNARWLVDGTTSTAFAKKEAVERALGRGSIVCLQETHWRAADAAIWELGIITRNLWLSLACSEAEHDGLAAPPGSLARLGGVAVLLPPGHTLVRDECAVLVPGHAVLCVFTCPKQRRHAVVNCYLRPGRPRDTWQALLAALPPRYLHHPDTVFVGDFNYDLSGPSASSDETQPGPALGRAGVVLAPQVPTCFAGTSPTIIDGAIVPAEVSHQWTVRASPAHLSDHAPLWLVRSALDRPPPQTACTPARFWGLPAMARAELRADLETVACALGVPAAGPGHTPAPVVSFPVPDGCGAEDPLSELLAPAAARAEPALAAADAEETVGWLPLLAQWGYSFIHGAFRRWWGRWRRQGPVQDPCQAELAALARRRDQEPAAPAPSPALQEWLASVGGPAQLSGREARHWLTVWAQLRRAERTAALPRRDAGPTVERDRLSRAVTAGRMVYRRRGTLAAVRLPDGSLTADPVATAEALLGTRQAIWFARPPEVEGDRGVLAAYMHGRRHSVAARPDLSLPRIRGAVLAPAGSGVGADGTPYEVYHLHPHLIACLLGQGLLAVELVADQLLAVRPHPQCPARALLARILGPSVDLLIWIPKSLTDDSVGGQRPLNLPTCLRRLFGGLGMQLLGPALEPHLDPGQAARAGGCCQDNIRAAVEHLDCRPGGGEGPLGAPRAGVPHSRWACAMLFGPLTAAVLRVVAEVQAAADPDIQGMPACFLLDQAKAFEYLSHAWLRLVLAAWGLPPWAAAFFLLAAEGRRLVGNPRPAQPGLEVLRGVGMGGPASCLSWALGFDPVSWIAAVAAAATNLTYVDDLLGRIRGPGQALLLYLCLLAATRLAHLRVADHSCVRISGPRGRQARRLLACLPVDVHLLPDDNFYLADGPVDLFARLLVASGQWAPGELRRRAYSCTCKTKHALIPAARHDLWAQALAGTPVGAAVCFGARFLGAHLCSRVAIGEGLEDPLSYTMRAVLAFALGTFRRCVALVRERVAEARAAGLSLANRSALWCTHCASTAPYPASILPMPMQVRGLLWASLESLFPTRSWARPWLITDLGAALHLKGAPRDPSIIADAASVLAIGRGGLAGPIGGHLPATELLEALVDWARLHGAAESCPLALEGAEFRAARLLGRCERGLAGFSRAHGLAGALYVAIWTLRRKADCWAYLHSRSASRRWAVSMGQEWVRLRGAPSWAYAWTICRLYLSGVPGNTRSRRRDAEEATQCHGCGCQGALRWRWLAGGLCGQRSQPSVGWCAACVADRPWGRVPLEALEADPALGPPELALPGPPCPAHGLFARCPLCGLGEASSEHLRCFCPAVQAAWTTFRPDECQSWWLGTDCEDFCDLRLRFNHAVAWLATSLAGKASLAPREGAALIRRRVSSVLLSPDADAEPTPARDAVDTLPCWEWPGLPSFLPACEDCAPDPPMVLSVLPPRAARQRAACPDGERLALELVQDAVPAAPVLTLRTDVVPALWPFRDDRNFGMPMAPEGAPANALWASSRCRTCGRHLLALQTAMPLRAGALLTAPPPPLLLQYARESRLLLSFDGGARHSFGDLAVPEGDLPRGGAGFALWTPADLGGRRRCLLQGSLSAPAIRDSGQAEAAGLACAVLALAALIQRPDPLEILGDNLGVIRLAACNARLRGDRFWLELNEPLMRVARQSWDVRWTAVRRHLNKTADALATLGVEDSLRRSLRGDFGESLVLWGAADWLGPLGGPQPLSLPSRPRTAVRWVPGILSACPG